MINALVYQAITDCVLSAGKYASRRSGGFGLPVPRNWRYGLCLLIRSDDEEAQMSPAEFAVQMTAADDRFAQALKSDDIREMRTALAEKAALLKAYFAEPPQRSCEETG